MEEVLKSLDSRVLTRLCSQDKKIYVSFHLWVKVNDGALRAPMMFSRFANLWRWDEKQKSLQTYYGERIASALRLSADGKRVMILPTSAVHELVDEIFSVRERRN